MKAESLLTVDGAAARLGKAPETVRRWIAAGTLATRGDGPRVLIAAEDLAPFMARPCEHCGATFTPARPNRGGRYCKAACADAARYAARKATHPATRGPGQPPKIAPANDPTPAALRPDVRAILDGVRLVR